MVIIEESTNYPTILGPKNVPRRMQWGLGRSINNLPSVIAAGMDRSFLPQVADGPIRKGLREVLRGRGFKAQTEKNIPTPWGPRAWYPGALIQTMPSVIQTGGGVAGPSRTMHPSTDLFVEI